MAELMAHYRAHSGGVPWLSKLSLSATRMVSPSPATLAETRLVCRDASITMMIIGGHAIGAAPCPERWPRSVLRHRLASVEHRIEDHRLTATTTRRNAAVAAAPHAHQARRQPVQPPSMAAASSPNSTALTPATLTRRPPIWQGLVRHAILGVRGNG